MSGDNGQADVRRNIDEHPERVRGSSLDFQTVSSSIRLATYYPILFILDQHR